jgi:hypothetical protein
MYTSKQNDIIAPLLYGSLHQSYKGSQPQEIKKNFAKLVDKLVESYKDGKISEEVLTELIKHAASVFIESEVTSRVDKALYKKGFSNRHYSGFHE